MARWECIVCGWIYDEAKGSPEDGVAPGTRWEDVPEDFLCPDCGVGKEDFERLDDPEIEETPHHEETEIKPLRHPVVILGTGLAGYNLAREFRKHDSESSLILITADDGRFYSKPMLSTGFTKKMDAQALATADAGSMAMQLNASVWTHTRVTAIDTAKQEICIGEATTISYDKLVLAWGADVIRPPLGEDALDHVYSVNDLLDYADFRKAVDRSKAKKIALIGAGLIGCEYTNDLLNGGFDVEAVDPLSWCLPTLLPEAAGQAVQRGLEEMGAKFHFGPLVTEVNKSGDGLAVSLSNGSKIEADLVVSAIGVRPRTEIASAAGIEVNRGIVVDSLLQTSAANVYSLGDCAEVNGHVLFYVAPLMNSARALAKTLAGEPTKVVYPAMPVTIKTPACPVVVAPPPIGSEGEWIIDQAEGNNVVARYVGADGAALGFALTGEGTRRKLELQKQLPALFGA